MRKSSAQCEKGRLKVKGERSKGKGKGRGEGREKASAAYCVPLKGVLKRMLRAGRVQVPGRGASERRGMRAGKGVSAVLSAQCEGRVKERGKRKEGSKGANKGCSVLSARKAG